MKQTDREKTAQITAEAQKQETHGQEDRTGSSGTGSSGQDKEFLRTEPLGRLHWDDLQSCLRKCQ